VGQAAVFTVDAYPGRSFRGLVTAIHKAPNLVQNVVTYTILVEAENPDLALFPGMTAVVRIVVEEIKDALRIPNPALRFVPREPAAAAPEGGRVLVWRLTPAGSLEPVPVLTGASDDSFAALIEGKLTVGDRLITGYAEPE
jgi:HlyD family secretion protein